MSISVAVDRSHINHVFDQNIVFTSCADIQLRSELKQAALEYTGIIPSLRLFLENVKYIRPLVYSIKRLLPPRFNRTIRQTMRRYYVRPQNNRFPVQMSDNHVEERPHPNDDYGFWSAYRQVFLFAMRHFYGLSDAHPLGHNRHSRSRQVPDSRSLWMQFRELTRRVGFVLPGSLTPTRPSLYSPEFMAIYNLLTRLRPQALFEYDPSILTQCSTQVVRVLQKIRQRRVQRKSPALTINIQERWSLDRRCGMTDIRGFFLDQEYPFLQHIYYPQSTVQGHDLSTFAVKRDMFLSVFPEFPDDLDMAEPIPDRLVNPGTGTEAPLPNETVGNGTMTIAVQDDTAMSDEPLMPTESQSATEQRQNVSPLPVHVLPSLTNEVGNTDALVPSNQVPDLSQNLVLFDNTPGTIGAKIHDSPASSSYALDSIKWQTLDAYTFSTTLSPGRLYTLFRG
ncbi:uncharacterized protein Aud_005121 [Aspergillus udagawae]|uniref:Uncharacterized protein n=1 Tax=Aspergillus udagawae TaxID=91492 RepID=A0A8E0UYP1_9EURO|nr:uncharacterized protein Aud_005121 [Aspergillus udagawae]GIC88723.1 hypothetical protein Aud_005121 [Aspergillus udagawae]